MKIITVQFDYGMNVIYDNLLRVFEYSAKMHMPDVKFVVYREKEPKIDHSKKAFTSNSFKLGKWLEAFGEHADDDEIIFMDCDMLVLKDLSPAFDEKFDIGYTKRTAAKMPYNGGVVFARNTPAAKLFIELWQYIDRTMYKNETFHIPYRNKYAGMNQAAFGFMKEFMDFNREHETGKFMAHVIRICGGPIQLSPKTKHVYANFKGIEDAIRHMDAHRNELIKCQMREFPCSEYNACKEDMTHIGNHTRVIHIKSEVRKQCIEYMNLVNRLGIAAAVKVDLLSKYNIRRTKALDLWSKYYHEAKHETKKA